MKKNEIKNKKNITQVLQQKPVDIMREHNKWIAQADAKLEYLMKLLKLSEQLNKEMWSILEPLINKT